MPSRYAQAKGGRFKFVTWIVSFWASFWLPIILKRLWRHKNVFYVIRIATTRSISVAKFRRHKQGVYCLQCDQIWRNFASFAKIKKSWAIFGKIISGVRETFEPVLANFFWAIGHILIVTNDQIFKKQFCHLVTLTA